MMQRILLLVHINSQMYNLTIRMHFDQFIAVQKEISISLPPTPFSALSHHAHFQTKNIEKSIAFSKYIGI